MDDVLAVILAAGEGRRMKSDKPKAAHEILGKSMLEWVYDAVRGAGIEECIVIVGHKAEQVMEILGEKVKYVIQEEQLGTGHALMKIVPYIRGRKGKIVVLYGDMPLVTSKTIKDLMEENKANSQSATVITAVLDDPAQYGRIIRDKKGNFAGIVEYKDADEEQRKIKEINAGLYCFDIEPLCAVLRELKNDNAQKEYYLPLVIGIMMGKGFKVGTLTVQDKDEIQGVNDIDQLVKAEEVARKRLREGHV